MHGSNYDYNISVPSHHAADRAVSGRAAAVRRLSSGGVAAAAHARRRRAAAVHTHGGPSATRLQDQAG